MAGQAGWGAPRGFVRPYHAGGLAASVLQLQEGVQVLRALQQGGLLGASASCGLQPVPGTHIATTALCIQGPAAARGRNTTTPSPGPCPSCWHRRSPNPAASPWGCAVVGPLSRLQARVAPAGRRAVLLQTAAGGQAGRAGGTLTPCRDPNPGLCLTQSTVCPGFPSRCTQGQRRRLAEQGDPWKVPRSRGHHARGARGRASPAAGRKVPRGLRARGRALAGPRCSRPAEAPLLTGAEAAGRDPRPCGQQ